MENDSAAVRCKSINSYTLPLPLLPEL